MCCPQCNCTAIIPLFREDLDPSVGYTGDAVRYKCLSCKSISTYDEMEVHQAALEGGPRTPAPAFLRRPRGEGLFFVVLALAGLVLLLAILLGKP
jgi:hypothetical protein